MTSPDPAGRLRRQPPAFRLVTVADVAPRTPRMVRVTLVGPELEGLVIDQPAASVRLLLPPAGQRALVLPAWSGNEFLLPDGTRPAIRTLTPLRADPEAHSLDVEIVRHDVGALAAWLASAEKGDEVALSGPGRGYPVDPDATEFLVAGDESAIPAIGQVLQALPPGSMTRVLIEVARPEARLEIPVPQDGGGDEGSGRPRIDWIDLPAGAAPGDALVPAVIDAAGGLSPAGRIWAAGEAAAMQRIRRHLFDERGLPRSATWIRGYWKAGRAGDAGDD